VKNILHLADISDMRRINLHAPDIKVCYLAVCELKIPLTKLARKLEMTISGVNHAVQ